MNEWTQGVAGIITFVMVDASYDEVAGLGGGFTLQISKNGGAFAPSSGVKAEISDGWYSYAYTVAEANTAGEASIWVTGAGCKQQNLVYMVRPAELLVSTVIEGTLTLEQVLRILLAFPAGTTTGANTTNPVFKSQDGLTDRIDMTVNTSGERSVVVVDGS